MSKKILAMLMAVAMAFSLLPVTAFATDGTQEGNSQPVTKSENKLTMKKTVKPNKDGTYTVHLESYATGSVTNTPKLVPMDIVLVLDVSGSMTGEITSYTYQATDKTSWSVSDVYDAYYDRGGWHRTDVTYYAKIGDEYYPVSYQSKWNWGYKEYWLEAKNTVLGQKVTDSTWKNTVYNQALYTRETDSNKTVAKLDAMKTAVNHFIESVAAQKNGDDPVAHRISIVKFAGEGKIVKGLTDVSDSASLKEAVNSLSASGATAADYGMKKAKDVLTNRENKEKPSIVIMFTDGEPNHGSGYSKAVAGATVDIAKTLKAAGTKVYTIGMFNGANPSDTKEDFNKYMNGVSSKYPNAFGTKDSWGWYTDIDLGDPAEGNYYFKADNAGDLEQVFQTISQSTTVTSPLDDKAVVVDNVPSNFALTEGSVKVYTAECTGKNDEKLTWSEPTPAQEIFPTSTKNDDGSQTISATGFNFSENWCGVDGDTPHGQKLIIEFTISCTNYGGTQPTNAGAYIKADSESTKEIISLENPQVPVTISLGSNQELLKKLKVEEEKTYNGSGFAILSEVAKKVDALVNGTNKAKNAYVNMELTVTVDGTTYTYKIRAGETAGKWYEGNREMNADAVSNIKTSPNVKRGEKNAVEPYTYNFNLKLSDKTEGGAEEASYGAYSASFTINPARVTVTANDQQVEKGTAPDSITYTATVTGLVNGEQEDLISRDIKCDAYTVNTAVGSELEITASGDIEQGNYTVTYQHGKLTVVAAPVTTGTLKVTKEVQGENLTLKSLPSNFQITVTGPNSYSQSFSLPENVGDSDKTVTWTISGLPAGEYTVSESNAGVDGYTYTTTYNNVAATQDNSATVTVKKGESSTMTVTNTYTKNATVNLSQLIQKQLTVKKDSALPAGTTFGVTVTPEKVNGQPATSTQPIPGTVNSLGNGTTNGDCDTIYTASFNFGAGGTLSLPAGTYTYTVQENATSPISGMQYDSNVYTLTIEVENSKATVKYTTGEGSTAIVVSKEKPLTIQNTYQAPDLTVTKQPYKVNTTSFDANTTVAHVGDTIVWEVSVKNNRTTPASTQLKDTLGGVTVYSDKNLQNSVNLGTDGTWTARVPANKTVTYYVTYKVQAKDIPKGKIVNTIVKDGDNNIPSAPVSTWDTKQLKSATGRLETSDWTTTVTLTLPTVNSKLGTQSDSTTAISKGSYVIDQIGNKFTFKNGLSLEVNGTKLSATQDTTNKNLYRFGTETGGVYPYTVTYTDKNDETKTPAQFKWEINQDIPAGTKVTLSYKLELTTREKNPGTYGVEDLKGNGQIEEGKTPIYTNEKAALYIKEKENNQEKEIAVFPMPSVSYTVSSGNSGSHSGGSRPSLNTKDHYGYIIGYPVDYYTGQPTTDQTKKPVRPEGKITRAEVATIYFRMLTDESRTKFWSQSNSYSDVKAGDWFNNAVSTLSNAGIIAGYEDGSFRPNGYITRAEFATIAARFFDVTYNGKDLFPDISGHWAKDYINQAANKGFVNGYEDGTFKPNRNITRAEAVTLVNRTLDRHPDKNHFTKDMLVWPDNMDQTKWYYADMQEATNSHTYQMKENSDKTKYENWTKTLPIRNWEALEKAWSNANSSQGNGNVV